MKFEWLFSRFYTACQWTANILWLNLLWMVCTVTGLIVFGFFPATTAMFAVTRKWLMGEHDISIVSTFITSVKKEFFKANVLGWILAGIGYLLVINGMYAEYLGGWLSSLVDISLITISIIYMIILLYIFPVVVHYRLKLFTYIKFAFIIGATNLSLTVMMVIGVILMYWSIRFIPGLMIFISGSGLAIILTWCSSKGFTRITEKFGIKESNV